MRNSLSALDNESAEHTETYVAQRSSKLLSRRDPKYLEFLFPHLFPFGIAGLSESRVNNYSKRDIICHLLRLSSQHFAKDPLFKLLVYDYLATTNVLNSMFVRAKVQPSSATNAATITPDELKAALKNKQLRKEALTKGRRYVAPTSASKGEKLLNSSKDQVLKCGAQMKSAINLQEK